MAIFDYELTPDEIAAIDALDTGLRAGDALGRMGVRFARAIDMASVRSQ